MMNLTIKSNKVICDPNNKILFTFPGDTLMDIIIPDLWNEILRYLHFPPYILGDNKSPHYGYHKMELHEFEICKNNFMNYYRKDNKHMIQCLKNYDFIDSETKFVIGDYVFSWHGYHDYIGFENWGNCNVKINYVTCHMASSLKLISEFNTNNYLILMVEDSAFH
jgi:hypothetical protein